MKTTIRVVAGVVVIGLLAGLPATGKEGIPVAVSAGFADTSIVTTTEAQVDAVVALSSALGAAPRERSNSSSLATLPTQDLDSGLTPTDLVNALLAAGSGAAVSNITYSGANISAGTFSGGTGIIGFESGIILSTGNIATVAGPANTDQYSSAELGGAGDSSLDVLISPVRTRDAAVLEFDLVCSGVQSIQFQYVFSSDEYNLSANNVFYNDVAGFFVDGTNVALLPDTAPVSVNNVNCGFPFGAPTGPNCGVYINNDCSDNCLCGTDTEGNDFWFLNQSCSFLEPCTASSECGAGGRCLANTPCAAPVDKACVRVCDVSCFFGSTCASFSYCSNPNPYPCTGYRETEMNGLTAVLTATAGLAPGTSHVKLAIADANDGGVDSNVFIKAGSLSCGEPRGACCDRTAFTCADDVLQGECAAQSEWTVGQLCDGLAEPCAPPPPIGACCLDNGCIDTTEAGCRFADGSYQGDDSVCSAQEACLVPEIRWNPVAATGNVICTPGTGDCGETEIILTDGGVTVTLFMEVSGWDTDADGDPTLGGYQGTLVAASLAGGIPENPGTLAGLDLEPVGASTLMGFEGAFQAIKVCSDDFIEPFFEEFDPLSRCTGNSDCSTGFVCVERPDYVYHLLDNTPVVSTAIANYNWAAASDDCATAPDSGETKFYGGTLLLEVPVGAQGTYNVMLVDDLDFTLFDDCSGVKIPGLKRIPGKITIGELPPVACCLPDGGCQILSLENCSAGGGALVAACLGDGNSNGTDDACEADCDGDGIPDVDETDPLQQDCDLDGICNGVEIADCREQDPLCADCNSNGVPDECDRSDATSPDCNDNLVPDECDIGVTSEDCNTNDVPDECDLADCPGEPACNDCQTNGILDECDILAGSPDLDGNGIPDECVPAVLPPVLPPLPHGPKNRYISIDASPSDPAPVAYRVQLISMKRCSGDQRRACIVDEDCPGVCDNNNNLQCLSDTICGGGTCLPTGPCVEHSHVGNFEKYIGTPFESACNPLDDCGDQRFAELVDAPVYRVWTESILHVTGCGIVPVALYNVAATGEGTIFTPPLTIGTIGKPHLNYADVVGPFEGDAFSTPDGFVNVVDVQAYIFAVQALAGHPPTTWVDLHGVAGSICQLPDISCIVPQQILNVADLQTIKFGFKGFTYTQTPGQDDPGNCP